MHFLNVFLKVSIFCVVAASVSSTYALTGPDISQDFPAQDMPTATRRITPFDPPNIAPLIALTTDNVSAMAFYFLGIPEGSHLIMDSEVDATLLHFAAIHSSPEMLGTIVAMGGRPNYQDVDGDTPLHWAAATGDLEVIETLLRLGCDKSVSNYSGEAPWHVAERVLFESVYKDHALLALLVNEEMVLGAGMQDEGVER